jgi:hypothetical protein
MFVYFVGGLSLQPFVIASHLCLQVVVPKCLQTVEVSTLTTDCSGLKCLTPSTLHSKVYTVQSFWPFLGRRLITTPTRVNCLGNTHGSTACIKLVLWNRLGKTIRHHCQCGSVCELSLTSSHTLTHEVLMYIYVLSP